MCVWVCLCSAVGTHTLPQTQVNIQPPSTITVDLARWLVVGSTLHPRFRDSPVLTVMDMGGHMDPTTQVGVVLQYKFCSTTAL